MSATVIPSVGPSMAEHLHGLRGGARPDFQEPLPSPEQLQALFDHHRADVPLEDFLRRVCETRPTGTATATFPLMLDSGNFFQGVSMPRIMDSLIRDNGNSVLKRLLREHAFGAIDKRRDGGLRILVRTSEAQQALNGEEVSIMGRKFRIGLESPLAQCFFLDVIGLSTAEEALKVFGSCGAKPVYFRPAAYDKVSGLCSTTWRFYFPGEEAPPSLFRDGSLRSYVRVGRKSYRCFGKNDASGGRSRRQNPPGPTPALRVHQRTSESSDVDGPTAAVTGTAAAATPAPSDPGQTVAPQEAVPSSHSPQPEEGGGVPTQSADSRARSMLGREMVGAVEPAQEDEAMLEQVSGGKRAHSPSHSPPRSPTLRVKYRFNVLDDFDGDADLEVATANGEDAVIYQILPKVSEATKARVRHRFMSKRPKHSSGSQDPDADEAITKALQELEETSLTAQAAVDADAIGVAERHVEAVKLELSRAKSAESLLNSIVAAPHAWQLALQASEVVDQFEDFISLHALNRQLLRLPNASSKSFTARLANVDQFSSGSRSQLIASITAAAGSSEEGRIGWHHARCVSLFELLLILMATHTFRDDSWLAIFATSSPSFLKRKGLRLLAEVTLRDLIHSSYGVTVVTESLLRLPGLTTLLELSGLQASADTVWMDLTLSEVNLATADQDMGPDRS